MKKYPKYKSSGLNWIDTIPSHWSCVRAQYLFDIVSGSTPNSNDKSLWDGNINWITPADFKTEDHYIRNGKRTITQKGYNSCSTTILPLGSIIFSKRAPIGKVVITSDELCTNQGCFGCIPNKGLVSNFFYYLMSILESEYNVLGSGSTFMEISAKEFRNFKLLVPPVDEQKAIAGYLDEVTAKVDSLMVEKRAQVEDLRKYRTSLITEIVTTGLNPNTPLRNSGIEWFGYIPEHWEIVPTQYLFDIISGSTPNSNVDNFWDGEIRWVTPSDFNTLEHFISQGKRNITIKGYESCSTKLVPVNSIIFSKRAPIGKVAITTQELCTNQGCFACVSKGDIEVNYYYYLMSILEAHYNLLGSGSTFMEISAKEFSMFRLIVPSLSEQQQIADYLDEKTAKIDSLIEELEAQLSDLATYKQAVITEAVTGKVDVRDWTPKS